MAAGALGVIVQGIVVAEVAHAAVAEKLSLRALWSRIKPTVWRLIGYSFLLALAVIALVTIVVVAIIAIATAGAPAPPRSRSGSRCSSSWPRSRSRGGC
jgi:hypothetical protein